MAQDERHPNHNDLADFVLGRTGDDLSTLIENHLTRCPACTHWLSQNDPSDDLADLIRMTGTEPTEVVSTAAGSETRIERYSNDVAAVSQFEQFGRFQVVRELGRGGMGIVFEAIDSQLRRTVALKVLLSRGSDTQRERLRREAEAVAQLKHPGIVQVFEVGECNGYPFVALELADSGSLSALMRERQFTPIEVASLARQIADALTEVHAASIVHRDLKPANVLVVARPEPGSGETPLSGVDRMLGSEDKDLPILKLTDFGVAMFADAEEQMTRTGMIVGTLGYMSPEQAGAERDSVGAGSDIYSVGVMLYELLTGEMPFQGGSTIGLLSAIRNDLPTPLRKVDPSIPADLETICMTCLEKDPGRRYLVASDLRDDLERFLRREPIAAKPPGMLANVMLWARRRPAVAVIYLLSLLLFGLHLLMTQVGGPTTGVGLDHAANHWAITALILGFAGSAGVIDAQMRRHPDQVIWPYIMVFALLVPVTIGFAFDSGPRSAPIPLLTATPLLSLFLRTKVTMIWIATATALTSYLALVAYAAIARPEQRVSIETAIAFSITLVIIATMLHLLIRRLQGLTAD